MLAKKKRLKRLDFNRFFSLGRRNNHRLFTLVHAPHPEFHASIVVSKKVAAGAVLRNKLRRRFYSMLQGIAETKKLTGVYIIILKKEAAGTSFKASKEALLDMLPNTR